MAPVYSPRQTDIKWVEEDHPTLYLTNYNIHICTVMHQSFVSPAPLGPGIPGI